MAVINDEGSIIARCPGCNGATSTFEWRTGGSTFGVVRQIVEDHYWHTCNLDYRLFRCAGCGRGGVGTVLYNRKDYPGDYRRLIAFYPESRQRLFLPPAVPKGIVAEFREAESCLENGNFRAAAGMVRSVLDKTLRANGYKTPQTKTLAQEIDAAAEDGIITRSRQRRAHEEIRVLGNDVLHDDWHPIPEEDVEAARHYCQRILEDFYDDRTSVEELLRAAGRKFEGTQPESNGG